MIIFPPQFVALPYPGYFWNTSDRCLYSLKLGGELRKLTQYRPNKWNNWTESYSISHHGERRWVTTKYLNKIKIKGSTVPIQGETQPRLAELDIIQLTHNLIVVCNMYSRSGIPRIVNTLIRDFGERVDKEYATTIVSRCFNANTYRS